MDYSELPKVYQKPLKQGRFGFQRNLARFFPDRIPLCDSPGGIRIGDHPGIMVAKDGLFACHAGHHRFAAARKAGKKMRLDKASENPDIGLHVCPVDPDLVAERRSG